RQPVQSTGMGQIVPLRDADALAQAIIDVLASPNRPDPEELGRLNEFYSPESVARSYENLFEGLSDENG
ncbi:MAG: glycosyltransferase, partial [Brevefilum sp.]